MLLSLKEGNPSNSDSGERIQNVKSDTKENRNKAVMNADWSIVKYGGLNANLRFCHTHFNTQHTTKPL